MFTFREHLCGEKQRRHPFYSSQAAACPALTACMRPTKEGKGEMGQEAPGGGLGGQQRGMEVLHHGALPEQA